MGELVGWWVGLLSPALPTESKRGWLRCARMQAWARTQRQQRSTARGSAAGLLVGQVGRVTSPPTHAPGMSNSGRMRIPRWKA